QDESSAAFGAKGTYTLWLGADAKLAHSLVHLAFTARNRAAVDAFYREGLKARGRDNGPPGVRKDYSPSYYAAFLLDPDGNNVEAVCLKQWPPCARSWRSTPPLHAAARSAKQSRFERLEHGARAITHAELGENARHVILDGALGRAEGFGDLAVAVTAGHEEEAARALGLAAVAGSCFRSSSRSTSHRLSMWRWSASAQP